MRYAIENKKTGDIFAIVTDAKEAATKKKRAGRGYVVRPMRSSNPVMKATKNPKGKGGGILMTIRVRGKAEVEKVAKKLGLKVGNPTSDLPYKAYAAGQRLQGYADPLTAGQVRAGFFLWSKGLGSLRGAGVTKSKLLEQFRRGIKDQQNR